MSVCVKKEKRKEEELKEGNKEAREQRKEKEKKWKCNPTFMNALEESFGFLLERGDDFGREAKGGGGGGCAHGCDGLRLVDEVFRKVRHEAANGTDVVLQLRDGVHRHLFLTRTLPVSTHARTRRSCNWNECDKINESALLRGCVRCASWQPCGPDSRMN